MKSHILKAGDRVVYTGSLPSLRGREGIFHEELSGGWFLIDFDGDGDLCKVERKNIAHLVRLRKH